jgi:hypothetical protein
VLESESRVSPKNSQSKSINLTQRKDCLMSSPTSEEIDALAELFERADGVVLVKRVGDEEQRIGLGLDMRRVVANALRGARQSLEERGEAIKRVVAEAERLKLD